MTLRGSLKDMGIVDLIQFPHAGRKTGIMIVVSLDNDARLFYKEGKLIHAETNGLVGIEVLTTLVDWTEGEFEFRPDDTPVDNITIEVDLHRAIMLALKERDEQKAKDKDKDKDKDKEEQQITKGHDSQKLSEIITNIISSIKSVNYATLCTIDGKVLAHTKKEPSTNGEVESLCKIALELVSAYPNNNFKRLFIEDEQGIAAVSRFSEDQLLFIAADNKANLGLLSITVSRISAALLEEIAD